MGLGDAQSEDRRLAIMAIVSVECMHMYEEPGRRRGWIGAEGTDLVVAEDRLGTLGSEDDDDEDEDDEELRGCMDCRS